MKRSEIMGRYTALYAMDSLYGRPLPAHKLILNMVPMFHDWEVDTILEVSCGRGIIARELSAHGFHVVCTEPNEYLLTHDLSRMEVFPFFVHELHKIEQRSFDMVMSIGVADHLLEEDADSLLVESSRLATRVVVMAVNTDPRLKTISRSASRWASLLKECSGCVLDSEFHEENGADLVFGWIGDVHSSRN
jgi:hypothetical protein